MAIPDPDQTKDGFERKNDSAKHINSHDCDNDRRGTPPSMGEESNEMMSTMSPIEKNQWRSKHRKLENPLTPIKSQPDTDPPRTKNKSRFATKTFAVGLFLGGSLGIAGNPDTRTKIWTDLNIPRTRLLHLLNHAYESLVMPIPADTPPFMRTLRIEYSASFELAAKKMHAEFPERRYKVEPIHGTGRMVHPADAFPRDWDELNAALMAVGLQTPMTITETTDQVVDAAARYKNSEITWEITKNSFDQELLRMINESVIEGAEVFDNTRFKSIEEKRTPGIRPLSLSKQNSQR